jgi:hypothetical protein
LISNPTTGRTNAKRSLYQLQRRNYRSFSADGLCPGFIFVSRKIIRPVADDRPAGANYLGPFSTKMAPVAGLGGDGMGHLKQPRLRSWSTLAVLAALSPHWESFPLTAMLSIGLLILPSVRSGVLSHRCMKADRMPLFDYSGVIIGIVVGMALAQILSGYAAIFKKRNRISGYWPVHGWSAILFLLNLQFWWNYYGWDPLGNLTLFFLLLSFPLSLFFASAIITPDVGTDSKEKFDMRAEYFKSIKLFLLICIVGMALAQFLDIKMLHASWRDPECYPRYAAIVLLALLLKFRSDLFHKISVVVLFMLVLVYCVYFTEDFSK